MNLERMVRNIMTGKCFCVGIRRTIHNGAANANTVFLIEATNLSWSAAKQETMGLSFSASHEMRFIIYY